MPGATSQASATDAVAAPFLPAVRRLEAVGFRAWPAANVRFDGSWQLRMTPGHPSRRLNCLVPLDPSDIRDIAGRIAAAERQFREAGLALSIRQTPLCPGPLSGWLSENGFGPRAHTHVMTGELAALDLAEGIDILPTHDAVRFSEACLAIDTDRTTSRDILVAILSAIRPASGLFLIDDEAIGPKAVTLCVQDNDLAGISQVVVNSACRRQGTGRLIVSAALRWARLRGARQAWLQVKADNAAAIALYRSMGFSVAYDQFYWERTP